MGTQQAQECAINRKVSLWENGPKDTACTNPGRGLGAVCTWNLSCKLSPPVCEPGVGGVGVWMQMSPWPVDFSAHRNAQMVGRYSWTLSSKGAQDKAHSRLGLGAKLRTKTRSEKVLSDLFN